MMKLTILSPSQHEALMALKDRPVTYRGGAIKKNTLESLVKLHLATKTPMAMGYHDEVVDYDVYAISFIAKWRLDNGLIVVK